MRLDAVAEAPRVFNSVSHDARIDEEAAARPVLFAPLPQSRFLSAETFAVSRFYAPKTPKEKTALKFDASRFFAPPPVVVVAEPAVVISLKSRADVIAAFAPKTGAVSVITADAVILPFHAAAPKLKQDVSAPSAAILPLKKRPDVVAAFTPKRGAVPVLSVDAVILPFHKAAAPKARATLKLNKSFVPPPAVVMAAEPAPAAVSVVQPKKGTLRLNIELPIKGVSAEFAMEKRVILDRKISDLAPEPRRARATDGMSWSALAAEAEVFARRDKAGKKDVDLASLFQRELPNVQAELQRLGIVAKAPSMAA